MWSELCRIFLQYQTSLENDPALIPSAMSLLLKPACGGTHLFPSVKHSSCQQGAHLWLWFSPL